MVLLLQLLERHFGAALSEAGRQQLDIAKQHAATVTATLNAINAYAEWAPLPDLSKYGIIHGYLFFCISIFYIYILKGFFHFASHFICKIRLYLKQLHKNWGGGGGLCQRITSKKMAIGPHF